MEAMQRFRGDLVLKNKELTPLINEREVDDYGDGDLKHLAIRYSILITMFLLLWHFFSRLDLPPSIHSPVIQSSCHEGEVWLIRHGEKNTTDRTNVTALYDLSPNGWQRAFYLQKLVESGLWPKFSAVFATAYASDSEIADSFPQVVRTKLGQSMVRREYQTVAPLAEQTLGLSVNTSFTKDDFSGVALAATQSALATCGVPVLISWDHCSLPALVRSGFGCDQIECLRCWPDHQYDEVMILTVKVDDDARNNPVVTSRMISMMREHWEASDTNSFDNDRKWIPSRDILKESVNIKQVTTCQPSYCSKRKVVRIFGNCVCLIENSSHWVVL